MSPKQGRRPGRTLLLIVLLLLLLAAAAFALYTYNIAGMRERFPQLEPAAQWMEQRLAHDNRREQLLTFESKAGACDLLIGLDNSGSMPPYREARDRSAAAFLAMLPATDISAGILLFNTEVLPAASSDLLDVSAYHDQLLTTIQEAGQVRPAGDTRFDTVLQYAAETFQRSGRPDSRKVLMLFSDGMPSQGGETFTQAWAEDFVTQCAAYREEMSVYLVVLNRSAGVSQGLTWLEENLLTQQVTIGGETDASLALSAWEQQELAKLVVIDDMDALSGALLTVFHSLDNHRILNKRLETAGITSFSLPPVMTTGVELFFNGDSAAMESLQVNAVLDSSDSSVPCRLLTATPYAAHYLLEPTAFGSNTYYLDLSVSGPVQLTVVQSFRFQVGLSVDQTWGQRISYGYHTFGLTVLDSAGQDISALPGLNLSLAYRAQGGEGESQGLLPLNQPVMIGPQWIGSSLTLMPQLQYGDSCLTVAGATPLTVENQPPIFRRGLGFCFYFTPVLRQEGISLGRVFDVESGDGLYPRLEALSAWPQAQNIQDGDWELRIQDGKLLLTGNGPALRIYKPIFTLTDPVGGTCESVGMLLLPLGYLALLAAVIGVALLVQPFLRLLRRLTARSHLATVRRQALTADQGGSAALCGQLVWRCYSLRDNRLLTSAAICPDGANRNYSRVLPRRGYRLNPIPGTCLHPTGPALAKTDCTLPLPVWLQEESLPEGSRTLLVFALAEATAGREDDTVLTGRDSAGHSLTLWGESTGIASSHLQPELLNQRRQEAPLALFAVSSGQPPIRVYLQEESCCWVFTLERVAENRLSLCLSAPDPA